MASRLSSYAILALAGIVAGSGLPVSAKSIQVNHGIPIRSLHEVLRLMTLAGILQSRSGPQGGYRFAVPPESISMISVIEIIDGPLQASHCNVRDASCLDLPQCPLHGFLEHQRLALIAELRNYTVADITKHLLVSVDPGAMHAVRPSQLDGD